MVIERLGMGSGHNHYGWSWDIVLHHLHDDVEVYYEEPTDQGYL